VKKLAILGIIVCVGLLVGSAAVIGGPAGPPEGLDVNVVNQDPIPVTGDLNATVSGDVNATVTGEVDVTNTPDVTVVNTLENPVPVIVQPGGVSSAYRFVGYSTDPTTGNIGLAGMYALCQTPQFGPLARMCTLEEFFRSANLTLPTAGVGAWVQPDFDFYNPDRRPDCGIWTQAEDSSDTGQIIASGGGIGPVPALGVCNMEKPVACCAPVN